MICLLVNKFHPRTIFFNIIFYNIFQVSARQIMRIMIRKRRLLNNYIVREKNKEMRTACGGSHNNIIDFSIIIINIVHKSLWYEKNIQVDLQ